jgi:hypothetical protein
MQQIAQWLETLGLSEYACCFADNDIDTSVLRHLTNQDLKEIGISLGHWRKMLAAIWFTEGFGTRDPKEAKEIAAVIGRGFSYPLVRAVAKTEDAALQTVLEQLAEADILLVQRLPSGIRMRTNSQSRGGSICRVVAAGT